jgi:hypothetical protein
MYKDEFNVANFLAHPDELIWQALTEFVIPALGGNHRGNFSVGVFGPSPSK